MSYSVCNLSKVKESNHVFGFQSTEPLENGFVVMKGDLVAGETEIYTAVKPTTAKIATDSLYVIKAPEILYDQSTYSKAQLGAFRTEANIPARGYEVEKDDVTEVSYAGLTLIGTDAVKGNYLVAQDGSFKLKEVTAPAGTEKFVAKITGIRTVGTMQYVGSNGQVGNQYKMVEYEIVKN